MLEDYQINEHLRYENHYLKVVDRDLQMGGVLGAALLCALLVDTEEGNRRGLDQWARTSCYLRLRRAFEPLPSPLH